MLGKIPVQEGTLAPTVGPQHHIVRQVHAAHKAHAQPVLGHKGQVHALVLDGQGVQAQQLFPAAVVLDVADGAAFHHLQAGDGLQQLLLTGAGNTGHA